MKEIYKMSYDERGSHIEIIGYIVTDRWGHRFIVDSNKNKFVIPYEFVVENFKLERVNA